MARLEMCAHKPFSQPVKALQKCARDSSQEVLQSRCVQYLNGLSPGKRQGAKRKERAPHKIRVTRQSAENRDPAVELKPQRKKNPFSSTLFPREEDSTLLQESSKHYYAPYYK